MSNSAESPKPGAPVPPTIAQTLDQIDAFLQRYLVCSTQQRTILVLWIAHTYCFDRFPVTPYLEIYSPEKQSGKTVCLRLLKLLCNHAWLPVGVTPSRLIIRIASSRPTLLLDNWNTVFRPSGSQSIVGFLDAGATQGNYYSFNPDNDYSDFPVFCPKAFAGHQRLPAPLADRCFPILLRRLKHKEKVVPFWDDVASGEAYDLTKSLSAWAEQNHDLLRQRAWHILRFPVPGLSVASRQLIAPLLTIATIAGGKWPRKLDFAQSRIAAASLAQPPSVGLQLLTDIRSFFSLDNDPPRIHTAPLLEYLNALEDRPWKKLTPNRLRIILQDFPIARSGTQRIGSDNFKGFTFQHFVESWESYLPQLSSRRSPRPQATSDQVGTSAAQAGADGSQVDTNQPQVGTTEVQVGANCHPETNNINDFNTCVFSEQLSRD